MDEIDPKIKDYCKDMWSRYPHLLQQLVNHQPTPVTDAINKFTEKPKNEFDIIKQGRDKIAFIPKEISKACGDKFKCKWDGDYWEWKSYELPLQFGLKFVELENEIEVKLSIYVGPWNDGDNSKRLVDHLRQTIGKTYGKTNSAKFSCIYMTSIKTHENLTYETMMNLLEKSETTTIISKIKEVLDSWPNSSKP